MSPLQELQQKIIQAVPSIETYQGDMLPMKRRDITLEDVLIALPGNRNWFVDNAGLFYRSHLSKKTYDCLSFKWALNTPLHLQSEETISELNKLIK